MWVKLAFGFLLHFLAHSLAPSPTHSLMDLPEKERESERERETERGRESFHNFHHSQAIQKQRSSNSLSSQELPEVKTCARAHRKEAIPSAACIYGKDAHKPSHNKHTQMHDYTTIERPQRGTLTPCHCCPGPRPLLVLNITLWDDAQNLRKPWAVLRGSAHPDAAGACPFSVDKLCKEFWRVRWATQSRWLSAEQKVALSDSFRARIMLRPLGDLCEMGPLQSAVNDTLAAWLAAVRIQASFRGWAWRRRCLWNPHHEVGRRRLRQVAERDCRQGL